jgi:hypothetical protein
MGKLFVFCGTAPALFLDRRIACNLEFLLGWGCHPLWDFFVVLLHLFFLFRNMNMVTNMANGTKMAIANL